MGAVLSQGGKPITFISKTLNKTERNYATNEKELYAIVWALKNLRNYLYGVTNLEIHTDHQPLTFALSPRNPNPKMKRWHAIIEEFSPKFVYQPGKTNVVADALSRLQLNHLSNESEDSEHSAQSSENNQIQETQKPLNQFKQQIILSKNRFTIHELIKIFGNKWHLIEYDTVENLMTILKEYIQPKLVTAIHCTVEDLHEIQEALKQTFQNKFVFTKLFPMDIINREDQSGLIEQTHNRAHRSYNENLKQIEKLYYWPEMRKRMKEYIRNCMICNKNKYDRHPKKIPIGKAPIPKKEGEQLHLDIFYAQKLKFITCVDAYSKFLILKHIEDKSNIEEKVLELLQTFTDVKQITLDNEPSFTTPTFKSLMQRLNIEIYFCDPRHSTTSGQVERVHSTIIEIARCIKEEYDIVSNLETVLRAAQQYNTTIHSVTNFKPNEVLYNKVNHENLPTTLKQAQEKMLMFHNKHRTDKQYHPGQIIYEKIIGERNKLQSRYKKQQVKENLGNNIIINNRNRIIHKDNIKS
uniref:RNA-directed DNA polymerase n=1 Tax=Bactrocera latifrons TaxID=174628 RepID=A0A0K8W058_BACLA